MAPAVHLEIYGLVNDINFQRARFCAQVSDTVTASLFSRDVDVTYLFTVFQGFKLSKHSQASWTYRPDICFDTHLFRRLFCLYHVIPL